MKVVLTLSKYCFSNCILKKPFS